MILVDSSVWIDYFSGSITVETELLDNLLGSQFLLTGDLILAEVLQGFKSDRAFRKAFELLTSLEYRDIGGRDTVLESARNYRLLRHRGVTVRSTNDSIIAAFCIRNNHSLLQSDRDYLPFAQYCGLKLVASQ